jgi:TldD protein
MSASPRKPVATVTASEGNADLARTHVRARTAGPAERPTGSVGRVIDHDVLERVLSTAMRSGGEFAEVYAEDKRSTSAGLDDGRVEQVTSGRDRGAGIRVIAGETTGFAHTSDLSEGGLLAAAEAAAAAARQGGGGTRTVALNRVATTPNNTVERFPGDVAKADKVELLRRIDDAARSAGAAIVQVSAGYADSRKRVLVANSDGLLADDEIVRLLLRISTVADGDAGMQTGFHSMGHTVGFEIFDTVDVEELARDAARQAITKLAARPAPSGSMPVVIQHGTGGVLFHEACGHGLEADHIVKGSSVYAGKVGELVASPLVTVVDDGTMAGEWGTLSIDDEGHPTQRNVLIQDGVLTDYMWDHIRSRKEGRAPSGNGRRQSYMHLPMVRMTNTFVTDGTADADDIVSSTEHGVYIARLGGGQVNTASGDFVFGMTEAYLIEDGAITEPLREANLIGNGPQALRDIDAVADDFAMGGPGTCGKDGQGVPVGTGQPTLRVAALTIGGTAA